MKNRFPTWFTAMNSSKPALPTLTPAEPRKPNVGCPGIMVVYASRVPRRVEMWNVVGYDRFCCIPARFAPTRRPATSALAS